MKEIDSRANIGYEIDVLDNVVYGVKQSDGSYNGLIGMVQQGKADVALAPLSISSERAQAIDFTTPFMEAEIAMLTKKPAKGEQLPFDSLVNMVSAGKTYGSLKNGVIYDFLRRSNFTLYKEMLGVMNNYFKEDAFPQSPAKGIDNVVTKDFVFLEESPFAAYWEKVNCSVISIRADIPIASYALGVPKGAGFKTTLDVALQEMKQDGTLDQLWDKWWRSASKCSRPKICMCNERGSSGSGRRGQLGNQLEFGIEKDTFGTSGDIYSTVLHKDGFPFSYRTSYLSGSKGFSVDLLNALANKLNVRFRAQSTLAWGVPQDDGTFDGMIGSLQNGDAVIATGPFTVPSISGQADQWINDADNLYAKRVEVVDFSSPIITGVRLGMLTNRPARDGEALPFESLEQLAESLDEVQLVAVEDSYVVFFLKNSKDRVLQKIAAQLNLDNNFVTTIDEGVQMVKSSQGASRQYVFLDEAPFTSAYAARDCSIVSVDSEVVLGDYAWALIKDSEFRRKVNYQIGTFERDGTLAALAKYHWFSVCPPYVTAMKKKKVLLGLGR